MKHKMTEADIAAQIAQLVDMPDTDIDTADIPEAPIENWALAKRPGLYKPRKKPVTLRLDTDVVSWFKDHAQSGGYQTEINRVRTGDKRLLGLCRFSVPLLLKPLLEEHRREEPRRPTSRPRPGDRGRCHAEGA